LVLPRDDPVQGHRHPQCDVHRLAAEVSHERSYTETRSTNAAIRVTHNGGKPEPNPTLLPCANCDSDRSTRLPAGGRIAIVVSMAGLTPALAAKQVSHDGVALLLRCLLARCERWVEAQLRTEAKRASAAEQTEHCRDVVAELTVPMYAGASSPSAVAAVCGTRARPAASPAMPVLATKQGFRDAASSDLHSPQAGQRLTIALGQRQ
jgi:hypothetical protein